MKPTKPTQTNQPTNQPHPNPHPHPTLLLTLLLLITTQPTQTTQKPTTQKPTTQKPTTPTTHTPPHIILLMADDQGWGQTSYNNHPHLKTPNLDAMAANGLQLNRFYAAAPNCSPTRATILTGRTNDRTGVHDHGHPLNLQEKTIAQTLRQKGYTTAHFGKWHLNGIRGPGVPILPTDTHHPGHFGFDTWFSNTNYFDRDPLISQQGKIQQHHGDPSQIITNQAIQHITQHTQTKNNPLLILIWYPSPHAPMIAHHKNRQPFKHLPTKQQHHLGELHALDHAIGTLRHTLRQLNIHHNTLLWYTSDNGGLPNYDPHATAHLRGQKNTLYEGGIRVPAIIEWPAKITKPRTTNYPASTLDIYPTLTHIANISPDQALQPQDGQTLLPLLTHNLTHRPTPIYFHHRSRGAIIHNQHKLILLPNQPPQQYNLHTDPSETNNIHNPKNHTTQQLTQQYQHWQKTIPPSTQGKDYPPNQPKPHQPKPTHWKHHPQYQPHLQQLQQNTPKQPTQ